MLELKLCVHGGGKAVTRSLAEKGIEAKFIDGLRVTDRQTIDVVDEVLNGSVNQEVASFVSSMIVKLKDRRKKFSCSN